MHLLTVVAVCSYRNLLRTTNHDGEKQGHPIQPSACGLVGWLAVMSDNSLLVGSGEVGGGPL